MAIREEADLTVVTGDDRFHYVPPRTEVQWLDQPEHHDYKAAADYLSLLTAGPTADRIADSLRSRSIHHAKAKDILRAAQLAPLPPANYHVQRDLSKIAQGEALSPILLIRGRGEQGVPLTIADGFHRVCAVHAHSEDTEIPYQITSWDY